MSDQDRFIVAILSAKGGSGRTSLATALARGLPKSAYLSWSGAYAPGLLLRGATLCDDPIAALPSMLAQPGLVIIEANWEHAFAAARIADRVIVPTRLDVFSMVTLRSVTLPLIAAAGTPAVLYVVDETEGTRSPAAPAELEHWWAIAERVQAVSFAPWRPSHFDAPGELGDTIDAAVSIKPLATDYDDNVEPCHLYRHLAADGTLLYVGISGDPIFRFRNGHKDKAWTHQVATVDVETFPTREMARTAELVAIAKENPIHNIADRPRGYDPYEDDEDDLLAVD